MGRFKWNAGQVFYDDDLTYPITYTQKIITQVIDTQDKETLKAIEKYCEENGIIPNLIDKDKLDLVLKLGINELNKRELVNGRSDE